MFTSSILRSALSVSQQASLKHATSKAVRLTIKPNSIKYIGKLYLQRIPSIFQWGALVGTCLFWPEGAASIIKSIGINNLP